MPKKKNWYSVAHSGDEYRAYSTAKKQVEKAMESDNNYIADRCEKFRDRLTVRVRLASQRHRDELSAVRDTAHAAYMVYLGKATEEIIKASRAQLDRLGIDETTIRTRYKQDRTGFNQTGTQTYTTTGKRGRFEVWTPLSVSPINMALYSLPKLGEIVIRHVKKNGDGALTFDAERYSCMHEDAGLLSVAHEWRIEGTKQCIRIREDNGEEVAYNQVFWPPRD